ncbi:RNA 3'-terminal phosphate cyclase [Actinopolymorpha sp. B11F2]|uniref:RNA 3'-terminal phosphate cyclase n=1 Tax=Actinopolymorpha sp. B11F2 TaxID=3160862 RepID=UPI0032E47317
MSTLLDIDGSAHSGSGMIVRQALAYAAITGTPLRMWNVRAHRPKPGLQPQHLCGVLAMRDLVGGSLEGAHLGSREFSFRPGEESPRGLYRFDVGTAGSATVLALALLPVLATAVEHVRLDLTGGLFQDRAPSPLHLQHVLVPLLGRMGLAVEATVLRPGYVPRGEGLLRLEVQPSEGLTALDASQQAPVHEIWGISLASHLRARRVSARMAASAREVLCAAGHQARIDEYDDTTAVQPGAGIALFADLADGMRLGADGAGAVGRPAEMVGSATAHRLLEDLGSGATLDRYAEDQIVVFAAFAAGQTRARPALVTEHLRAALWLAELFGVASTHHDAGMLVIEPRRERRTGGLTSG